VTLSDGHLRAIAGVVQDAGGDQDDAESLAAVWERLEADAGGRVARLRYEAANPSCCCTSPALSDERGRRGRRGRIDPARCERCLGTSEATR
jgi:hypothetical protein